MAALLDPPASDLTIYFSTPITRVEKAGDDGSVLVYGKCTGDDLDLDDQIIDRDFARSALQKWFDSYANIRQMHSTMLPPGGKGVKLEEKDDGFYLTAKVIEPTAVRLVKEGAYQAYSIGISRPVIVRDTVAKNGRVTGGIVSEVSLVDFPANPTTKFMLADETSDVQKIFSVDASKAVEHAHADVRSHFHRHSDGTEHTHPHAHPEGNPDHDTDAHDGKMNGDTKTVETDLAKDELSSKERDALDDKSFAYIDSKGGRHLPIHDENHVRAALGRFSQTQFESDDAKKAAAKNILDAAAKHDIDVSPDSAVAQAAKEAKVLPTDPTTDPVTEGAAAPAASSDLLNEAIRLAKDGQSEDALAKLRAAVDADLAREAAPVSTTVQAPIVPAATQMSATGTFLPPGQTTYILPPGQTTYNPPVMPVTTPIDPPTQVTGDFLTSVTKAKDEVPPVDQEVTDRLKEADAAVEAAEAAQAQDNAAHLSGKDEKDEKTKGLDSYGLGLQHQIRQLHDALCPAYSWPAVAGAHPALSKGSVADAFGPRTLVLLHSLAGQDPHFACAERDLLAFLGAETAAEATPELLQSVREDLHKCWSEFYPTVTHLSPLTLDAGDAGRWNRRYQASGRAAENGSSTTVSMPSSEGRTPQASDFRRGPLLAGHERPAPESANKDADADIVKRTFYTNAAKDDARSAMAVLHDHIASVFPEICGTGVAPSFDLKVADEPIPDSYADRVLGLNPQNADLHPEPLNTSGDFGRPAPHTAGFEDVREGGTQPAPAGGFDADGQAVPGPGKAVQPDLTKALEPAITKAVEPLVAKIEELSKRLDDLERQPDPAQAPWRGAVVALNKLLESQATPASQPLSEVEQAGFEARKERVEYLMRVSNSSDPQMREQARSELRKLLASA